MTGASSHGARSRRTSRRKASTSRSAPVEAQPRGAREGVDEWLGVDVTVVRGGWRSVDQAGSTKAQRLLGQVDVLVDDAASTLAGVSRGWTKDDMTSARFVDVVAPSSSTEPRSVTVPVHRSGRIIHIASVAQMAALPLGRLRLQERRRSIRPVASRASCRRRGLLPRSIRFTKNDGLSEHLEHVGHEALGRRQRPMRKKLCTRCSIQDFVHCLDPTRSESGVSTSVRHRPWRRGLRPSSSSRASSLVRPKRRR